MKSLGLFSPVSIQVDELKKMADQLHGTLIGSSTMRFGEHPDEAYLEMETSLEQACFDEEERGDLTRTLGFEPKSYVNFPMNYSAAAYQLALSIASLAVERWGGKIDYSDAGGDVDLPPPSSESSVA